MRRRSQRFPWVLLIVGLMVGFALLGGAAIFVGLWFGAQRNAMMQQRQQPIGQQFGMPDDFLLPHERREPPIVFHDPVPLDPEQTRNFGKFFNRLSVASADPKAELASYFDFERMHDELLRVGAFRAFGLDGNPSAGWFREGAITLIPKEWRKSWSTQKWKSIDLRRIGTANSGEVVLSAVVTTETGMRVTIRFYLSNHIERGWRLYDWEDLEVGLHPTHVVGAELVAVGGAKWREKLQSLENMPKATQAIHKRDMRAAQKLLDECNSASTPPFDDPYDLVSAHYELRVGQPNEAQTRLEDLLDRNADMPFAYLLRAELHNRLHNYDEAVEDAERYMKWLGADADAMP